MHLHSSVVKINLSPTTIHTLAMCVAATSKVVSDQTDRDHSKEMTKLWELQNVQEKGLWYLETPGESILSPGSMVISRVEQGDYQHGFLSKKDTHFTVYLYPEGTVRHLVTDTTAVTVDKCPDEEKMVVGANVVALHEQKGKLYMPGRIMSVSI